MIVVAALVIGHELAYWRRFHRAPFGPRQLSSYLASSQFEPRDVCAEIGSGSAAHGRRPRGGIRVASASATKPIVPEARQTPAGVAVAITAPAINIAIPIDPIVAASEAANTRALTGSGVQRWRTRIVATPAVPEPNPPSVKSATTATPDHWGNPAFRLTKPTGRRRRRTAGPTPLILAWLR